jgi:enoyl-CoA hydratase
MKKTYDDYECLLVEREDRLATVTLNRPEHRNAINHQLHTELARIWLDLAEDDEVTTVLLTGAGDMFSVGGDVSKMGGRPGGDVLAPGAMPDPAHARRIVDNLLSLDKPVVTAINGHAIGLAATVALLTDITVMSTSAKIADTHVKVGLVAGDGGAAIWPLLVGPSRAKELLMRGLRLDGAEAARIGLVNHAVPAEEVLPFAREIAVELANGATWAIRWTKLSVNKLLKQQMNLVFDTSMALEMATFHTEDHREAVSAFLDKRTPRYTGR